MQATIHDPILTTPENVDLDYSEFHRRFYDLTGITPKLKIDWCWECDDFSIAAQAFGG